MVTGAMGAGGVMGVVGMGASTVEGRLVSTQDLTSLGVS